MKDLLVVDAASLLVKQRLVLYGPFLGKKEVALETKHEVVAAAPVVLAMAKTLAVAIG